MSNTELTAVDPWETGQLGLEKSHAVAAPESIEAEVDNALAMQLISIRLPKDLIEDLKLIAKKEGLGYQPLIRRLLVRFAAAEMRNIALQSESPDQPLEDLARAIA